MARKPRCIIAPALPKAATLVAVLGPRVRSSLQTGAQRRCRQLSRRSHEKSSLNHGRLQRGSMTAADGGSVRRLVRAGHCAFGCEFQLERFSWRFRLKVPLGDRGLGPHPAFWGGCFGFHRGAGTVASASPPTTRRRGHPPGSASLAAAAPTCCRLLCQRFLGPRSAAVPPPLVCAASRQANLCGESRPINSPPQSTAQHGRSALAVSALVTSTRPSSSTGAPPGRHRGAGSARAQQWNT